MDQQQLEEIKKRLEIGYLGDYPHQPFTDLRVTLAEVERLQAENEQLKFNLTMAQHYDAPEWLRRKTR